MDQKALITNQCVEVDANSHVSSIAGKYVEHTTATVLWENTAPTVEFGAGTIYLDFKEGSTTERYNIDDYDYLVIWFVKHKSKPNQISSEEIKIDSVKNREYITSETAIFNTNDVGTAMGITGRSLLLQGSQFIASVSQYIEIDISGKVIINGASNGNNVIPLKIIGYKYS